MVTSSTSVAIAAPIGVVVHDASQNAPTCSVEHFGYTLFGAHDSRHDRHVDDEHIDAEEELPAYDEEAALPPAYSRTYEHPTLARMLFMFGFVFFPAWVMGAFILTTPLAMPPPLEDGTPSWLPEKTEAEREELLASMRRIEVKWAKRCLLALVGFVVFIVALIFVILMAMRV
ncbi:hypothetical protein FISHEDRAFT_41162 [Fistulina hepatica ATCC 64428]|nr:hypothetical protein FISHEDRAFT_41162 [Fistulina hepatica ATCC 64428]